MPLSRMHPDHRDPYFKLVGPLKTKYWKNAEYLETFCHLCGWSDFGYLDKCRASLLKHLWDWHDPHPKPQAKDRMPPPGR